MRLRAYTTCMILTLLCAASLAHAAAAADCKLVKFMTLDMTPLSDGRVTVPVQLMDRPSALLLDTAGGYGSISPATMAALGLFQAETPPQPKPAVNAPPPPPPLPLVLMPSLTLGGAEFKSVNLVVMSGEEAATIANGPDGKPMYDGLFAPDLFLKLDLEADFGANKATFFSQDHCPGQVVYWPAAAIAELPFTLEGANAITFEVMLDGKPVKALLDTGAVSTTLDLVTARRTFDVDTDEAGVEKIEGVTDGYQKRFKSLAFGDIALSNPLIAMTPMREAKAVDVRGSRTKRETVLETPPLVIGMSTLRRFHIYFAFGEKKLYITPASAPAKPAAPAP